MATGRTETVRGIARRPGFLPLLASEVVSGLGSMMTSLALRWFVLQTTGSATRASAVLADIEGLFTIEEYLAMYNSAFGTTVTAADLETDDSLPIVKRFGVEFDHGLPAEQMLRDPERFVDSLSIETLKRFEKLFGLVNRTTA